MPWKDRTVKNTREEFVNRILSNEKSKSALCREYNISRPTGDKWISRYKNGDSMKDRSRKPFGSPNKTDTEVEQKILDLRKTHPAQGATKLRRMLENEGEQNLPCNSTVNAILKRNGCIKKEASEAAKPYNRFEKELPNDMWQVDFKGKFQLENKKMCYPLCILDDHSRFNLCIEAKQNEKRLPVIESFKRIFLEYGMPKTLLCDNGNPWGTAQSTGITLFEVWLMDLGILVLHGRVYHPQTQGKEERFNGSLKRELLKFSLFKDFNEAQLRFDEYRMFYNNERPHHALQLDVPAQHYVKSNIPMPEKVEEWKYTGEYETRTIKTTGFFTYKGQGYYLSESLGSLEVGVKPSSTDGFVNLFYRNFRIARINIIEQSIVSRRIYLAENDPRFEPCVRN